tara:strand:- start:2123 stop:2776 length:654 start_codon:yes stop_codon:yes gene_type:complete
MCTDLARILDSIGITNKGTQALINGILSIWNFGIALTSAFLTERIGRRPLFRISTLGMLIIFTTWTICSALFAQTGANSAAIAVLVFIFIFQFFYCIAFSPLPVAYSVEILTYSVRAKGMATYVFSTKVAVFVNQYVNPIGLQNAGWKYYMVYVVILLVESIIAYLFFLETKGKALEEISVLFDGEEADVKAKASEKLAIMDDTIEERHEYVVPKKI